MHSCWIYQKNLASLSVVFGKTSMTTTQAVKGHPEKYRDIYLLGVANWSLAWINYATLFFYLPLPFFRPQWWLQHRVFGIEAGDCLSGLWCLHFNEPANSLTPAACPYLKARGGMRWNFTWDRLAVVSSTNSNMYSPVWVRVGIQWVSLEKSADLS